MIVVDTTVWIDFLEARATVFDRRLTELIGHDISLALTDLIYCEVLQGIREDDAYQRTRELLLAYPILRLRGLETFERAANLYRSARRRGLTIRKTADCLIAATCLDADVELYHSDQVAPLRVYRS